MLESNDLRSEKMATKLNSKGKEQLKRMIVYEGKRAGYIEARALAEDRGGLPPNVLHDDILIGSNDWRHLGDQGYYPAFARELYVHPETDKNFQKGNDVIDSQEDSKGRRWRFPAELMVPEAFDAMMPSLFVNPDKGPKAIEANNKWVTIAGVESIVVVSPSIQVSGQLGRVHGATRLPLYVDEREREGLQESQKRILYRIKGAGVRFIVRDKFVKGIIDAERDHDSSAGVGHVTLISAEFKLDSRETNWLATLRKGAEAAEPVLLRLKPVMKEEDYEKLANLVRTAKLIDI